MQLIERNREIKHLSNRMVVHYRNAYKIMCGYRDLFARGMDCQGTDFFCKNPSNTKLRPYRNRVPLAAVMFQSSRDAACYRFNVLTRLASRLGAPEIAKLVFHSLMPLAWFTLFAFLLASVLYFVLALD